MSGVPCEHACAVIKHLTQNIIEFVDDMFKCPTQQKIYSSMFREIDFMTYQKSMTMVLFGMLLSMFTSL